MASDKLGIGLSPRVRGIHRERRRAYQRPRSIPACAGDPDDGERRLPCLRVYPRVCGGSCACRRKSALSIGLSPRVRGIPYAGRGGRGSQGSIPACAGDPSGHRGGRGSQWVYPRVCGGSEDVQYTAAHAQGLSPRVRGIPPPRDSIRGRSRSIPACAGDPSPPKSAMRMCAVYPRVCGGSPDINTGGRTNRGLSPRVRGIRRQASPSRAVAGSIPACAGDPMSVKGEIDLMAVYPRVCGGSASHFGHSGEVNGLSPRVRGIHRY